MLWINIKLHTFFPDDYTDAGEHSVLAGPRYRLHLLLAFVSFGSFNSIALQPPPPFLDGRTDVTAEPPAGYRMTKGFFFFCVLSAEFQCGYGGSGVS